MKLMGVAIVLIIICLPIASPSHDNGENDSYVEITKPRNGIYFFDMKIMPLFGQIVIGAVTVEVRASDNITNVEFMVPPKVGCRPVVLNNDSSPPFSYYWNTSYGALKDKGFVNMMVRGYTDPHNFTDDDIFLVRIIL